MIDGYRIGLALGGGAARGLAHIGVLKVFEREGISIDLIAGTSIGALVGGVYATTRSAAATEKRFLEFIFSEKFKRDRFDFLRESRQASPHLLDSVKSVIKRGIFYSVSMAKPSFVSAQHFEHNINGVLDDVQIEKTVIPFAAVAADIHRGEQVLLQHGSLRRAVSASSAVPGLLPPVSIDDRVLIDGGCVAKVPVIAALLMGADLVIGVDVSRELEEQVNLRNGLNIMVRANSISNDALKSLQCRLADVVIVPDVQRIHWADFSAMRACVARGEEAAQAGLDEIRRQHRAARWASFLGISRARRLARYYRGASHFRGVE